MNDYFVYLSQMNNCVSNANKVIDKAKSYEQYSNTLKNISEEINAISNELYVSNSMFLTGGYNSGGKGLYQDQIMLCGGQATSIASSLDSLSTQTKEKIKDFKKEYDKIKVSYESAKNSFYACPGHIGFVPDFPNFPVII